MAEYHVGCGAFAIYAGTLNSRNKNLWQNKSEVTNEAVSAVAQYLLQEDNHYPQDTVLMSLELFNEIRNIAGEAAIALETDIDIPIYDQEEIYHNCTVQVLYSSYTGDSSVGWWREGDAE